MSLNYKTPAYFSDFQCLGGDCPDTCCQQWDIRLDREHYDLLSEFMDKDDEQQKLFKQYIRINEQPVTGDHDFAYIAMNEKGQCPMLEGDGLCSIHRKFGVEPLGNICAFFPRVISRCEDNIEMSGALSCPEVARRCLGETEPVRLSRFKLSGLPRQKKYPIHRELPRSTNDFYAKHFKEVRRALQDILALTSFSIDTRLYALAAFAQRVSDFYHKDCSDPQPMLGEVINQAISDVARLDEFLAQYETQEPVGLIVIHSILQIKQQRFPAETLSQMAEMSYQRYIHDINPKNDSNDVDAQALQKAYQQRAESFERAFPGKLDQYLARYLENCIYREWFYTMPDVFTYIQMLLIRIAILRFLILSHPQIIDLVKQQLEKPSAMPESALLDKIIYVVYNYARAIDQNTAFLQVIYNAVSEQQMMNHDYSLAFIKL